MTKDEIELMQDSIIQAPNKVELLQKTIIEKAVEIERLKAEFKQLETNAEILARGVRDLNHENYELTKKVEQAKINVLNELKDKIQNAIDTYWNSNGGGYYLAEDAIDDIDEMIEELKKNEE